VLASSLLLTITGMAALSAVRVQMRDRKSVV